MKQNSLFGKLNGILIYWILISFLSCDCRYIFFFFNDGEREEAEGEHIYCIIIVIINLLSEEKRQEVMNKYLIFIRSSQFHRSCVFRTLRCRR